MDQCPGYVKSNRRKDGRKIDEDNGIDRGGEGQERKKEQNKQS